MLVFASDLHLTDGTTCANIGEDAFYLFTERIRDMAYRASFRANNRYSPIERIDIVLLGDIFDLLHSVYWEDLPPGVTSDVDPWTSPEDGDFQKTIATITDGILTHNAKALAVLKQLTEPGTVRIPTRARPPSGRVRKYVEVPVKIYYMNGNHDWYFHLPGEAYNAIRGKVIDGLGLSNPNCPFPYSIDELPELEQILQEHSVYARHGDFYDSFNFNSSKGRCYSTLGDAVAVKLIDRFPTAVHRELGEKLSPDCITQLREIVNIRPPLLAPTWINSLLRQNCEPSLAQEIKAIWNDLANDFLKDPFVRAHDRRFRFDTVDGLEALLFITKNASFDMISNLMTFFTRHFWGGNLSFAKNALNEKPMQDHDVRFVVYGHTHHQEVAPLDIHRQHDVPLSEICFNTGTWHALHTATETNPQFVNFVSYYTMTYVAFFKGNERRGKSYETWSGTLGWE